MKLQTLYLLLIPFLCSSLIFGEPHVFKYVLKNGLTLLVRPVKTSEKVSMQIWYNVGSKDEMTCEKGLAHLIEHMIFGGTEKLSETDIPLIANKLSGYLNASTNYDCTNYFFDVPREYWKNILPIMADCMENCKFDEDKLNAELKVVIQELKMRAEHYTNTLALKLLSAIMPDHPYHYPIIGYKQDLWNLSRDALVNFYKKHYVPNNATLVVVGDVEPEEVLQEAEINFGHIKANFDCKKPELYFNKDIESKIVTIYRDVKLPQVMLAFVIPGAYEKNDFEFNIISMALAGGKEGRLHKKLVDELQLVNGISVDNLGLFDVDFFGIFFEPKECKDIESITNIIIEEILKLQKEGITEQEFQKTHRCIKSHYYSSLENNHSQAHQIAECYLVTNDPEYAFQEPETDFNKVNESIKRLAKEYLRPIIMHKGFVLPLPENEKNYWLALQERSDKEDARVLDGRIRESDVEGGRFVNQVKLKEIGNRTYPQPKTCELSNGIKVFCHDNPNIPKISFILDLKVTLDYEPDELSGLCRILSRMLLEGGTQHYSAQELDHEIGSRGMNISVGIDGFFLNVLSEDFEKGLELVNEMLQKAQFDKKVLEKVRQWELATYKRSLDDPLAVGQKMVREFMYKGHPYSKSWIGTPESINTIKRKHLVNFYKKYFTPYEAKISVVGDFKGQDIPALLEKVFGSWQGPKIEDIEYPNLEIIEQPETISQYINRDQVSLALATQSIDRFHEDFDKLILFDQMFIKSMSSILFEIRERTGIFYYIDGSTVLGAGKQPGLGIIYTKVSLDRLEEAKALIKEAIKNAIDLLTEQQLIEAKNMILNNYDDMYSKNSSIASSFVFLDNYNLPFDYFEKRHETFAKINLDHIKEAAKKIFDIEKLVTFQVGRLE